MTNGINHLWMVASSGIHSRQRHLDLISHNVANSNTVGFKAGQAGFQALVRNRVLTEEEAALYVEAEPGDVIQDGMGTLLTHTTHLFSQGNMSQTDDPYNMAISGDGLFQVVDADGTELYTRAGDFQRDAAGRLVNHNGHVLQPEVEIPEEVVDVYIDAGGRVLGRTADDDAVQELGTVQLAVFQNPEGLERVGDSAFVATGASGPAELGDPGTGGRGTLLSGFLEESNVDLGRTMTDLLRTQRAYSLSLRALQTADEIYRMANEMPQS